MTHICEACKYSTDDKSNFNRHLKSLRHSQSVGQSVEKSVNNYSQSVNDYSQSVKKSVNNYSQSVGQDNYSKPQPTLEPVGYNQFVVHDSTDKDKDSLSAITDEVIESAKHLNKINKAIPKPVMREITHTDRNTEMPKQNSKIGLGIVALIISLILIVVFWDDFSKFITAIKNKQSSGFVNNANSYGFSIERY